MKKTIEEQIGRTYGVTVTQGLTGGEIYSKGGSELCLTSDGGSWDADGR